MSVNKTPDDDLADYLRRRLDYLERCNTEIEDKLATDLGDLRQKIDNGEYSKTDPDVGRIIFHLESVVGNTFRYTMLVGVCSFLEEAMKAITKRLLPDYDEKIKAQERGNWLRKHIRILPKSDRLNVAAIQSDCDKFCDLYTLRNCVTHAWGKVAEARNPDAVKEAVRRIRSVDISKDGYLLFDDDVVSGAMNVAESIVDHILDRN